MDPVVRIEGLPDFNTEADQQSIFNVEEITNWDSTAPPVPVIVPNGGGPGAIPSGPWQPAEEYVTLVGLIRCPPGDQEGYRRALLAGLPADRDRPLVVLGGEWDTDKQMWVRRYDRPTIVKGVDGLTFTIPLMAADPYKYGLGWDTGEMGVYTGSTWFRTYGLTSGTWNRRYSQVNGRWVRSYQQRLPSGPYPQSVALTSDGDVTSYRVTATVTGPLDRGDWWLLNETTGARMWADIGLDNGQTVTFDSHRKIATLDGAEITSTVYGDWLTYVPGPNLFRLVAGTQTDAVAAVTALPAYQ